MERWFLSKYNTYSHRNTSKTTPPTWLMDRSLKIVESWGRKLKKYTQGPSGPPLWSLTTSRMGTSILSFMLSPEGWNLQHKEIRIYSLLLWWYKSSKAKLEADCRRQGSTSQSCQNFLDLGGSVGLLFRLTESIWRGSSLNSLGTGSCIIMGPMELGRRGLFASVLTKKWRYWTNRVRGNRGRERFWETEVGAIDAGPGLLGGIKFHMNVLKGCDYDMSLMLTYGTLDRLLESKLREYKISRVKGRSTFECPEVVLNHSLSSDSLDNCNSYRISSLSWRRRTWKTKR